MKATKKRSVARSVMRVVLLLTLLGVLAYAALIGWVCYREANVPAPTDYDSIIVLGAQVRPDGLPSVQLRWRLDKAKEMYELSPCPIVVSGAQGGREPAPEGQVMREVLISEGLPEAHVFSEIESLSTQENIANSWAMLQAMGCERPLVVTSDYHLPRALAIAQDAGLPSPQGAGSLCRPEINFWLQNHAREALAWVKYWLIKYVGLPL